MALKKITIKDVAREAGVSISTVSNALNDVDVLHPDTKRHILEVADRMNYIPNINGRNLKAQATKVIGLFITSIRGPYYGTLADSIYSECLKHGYELNIFVSDKPNNIMTNILGKRVDGAIILNDWVKKPQTKMLLDNDIPTVFIDREQDGPNISSVVFDSYYEGEQAAKYLLELGHKSFAFVQGVEHNYDSIERQNGFEKILKQAGITLQKEYVIKGNFERETAYNAVKDFLEKGYTLPDAIFAANDESAIGTIDALLDEGIKVPEQVSVIGCDDIDLAKRIHPSLTTIRTSFERQGVQAVIKLVSMIRNETKGTIETLHGRIIPRESTCPRE